MTVQKLIELLQEIPPHLTVIMADHDVFANARHFTIGPPAHMQPFPEQREVVVIWPLEETEGPYRPIFINKGGEGHAKYTDIP